MRTSTGQLQKAMLNPSQQYRLILLCISDLSAQDSNLIFHYSKGLLTITFHSISVEPCSFSIDLSTMSSQSPLMTITSHLSMVDLDPPVEIPAKVEGIPPPLILTRIYSSLSVFMPSGISVFVITNTSRLLMPIIIEFQRYQRNSKHCLYPPAYAKVAQQTY